VEDVVDVLYMRQIIMNIIITGAEDMTEKEDLCPICQMKYCECDEYD